MEILYRKFITWQLSEAEESAGHLQMYVFPDAPSLPIPGEGSMESYILLIRRSHSRNGDILRSGGYADGGARRVARVCRSSISSEYLEARNAADAVLYVRVVTAEMILGRFVREIVDPIHHFNLMPPFGIPPSAETAIGEMSRDDEIPQVSDLRHSSADNGTFRKDLFGNRAIGGSMNYTCRMLLLTDSSDVYSSLLSGKGSSSEKSARVQISYWGDMGDAAALTFIDASYNLSAS